MPTPLCQNCRYDLTGLEQSGTCPECGTIIRIGLFVRPLPEQVLLLISAAVFALLVTNGFALPTDSTMQHVESTMFLISWSTLLVIQVAWWFMSPREKISPSFIVLGAALTVLSLISATTNLLWFMSA